MARLSNLARRLFPRSRVLRGFRRNFGYDLDLGNARTFNEKIYRERLVRDPSRTIAVDKVLAKQMVAKQLGAEWIVPTLWHGPRLPPRQERTWPTPFVLKANHGSGWNLFIRSDADKNWDEIEETCERWLATNYGHLKSEWAYRNVVPQLLVEPQLGEPDGRINDYRVFVFGGRAAYIGVDFLEQGELRGLIYDRDWQLQDFARWPPRAACELPPPHNLERMIAAAELLARPYKFVRVDLYDVDRHPYFGEMTFYPGGGNLAFDPPRYDEVFGALWPD